MKIRNRAIYLTLILLLLIQFTTNKGVYSATYKGEIYVYTEEINKNIQKYAVDNFENFSAVLPEVLEGQNTKLLNVSAVPTMGSGFKMNDVAFFPILIEEKVIALVSIFEDSSQLEGLTWSLSVDFSNGLNLLNELSSREKPANLYIKDNNVYAEISSQQIYKLTDNPILEITSNDLNLDEKNVVNIMDPILINRKSVIHYKNNVSTLSARQKYLTLDLKETQSDQPWCSAFAGAQILRYKGKGNIYAKDIMKYFYPKLSDSALKKESISHAQLIKYANIKKSYPKKDPSTLVFSKVKTQIDNNKPIYLSAYGSGTYEKARHALVLRGYNENHSSYSVWNPWNKTYVSMPISSKKISVSGGTFTWDSTIYDW